MTLPDFLEDVPEFACRSPLIDFCLGQVSHLPGDVVEFGTYQGVTARMILRSMGPSRRLFCCDSWEGLPEEWDRAREELIPAGHFATSVPDLGDDRAVMIQGWYKDTGERLLELASPTLAMVHIDCDLYSSTVTALATVRDRLQAGTVILFDELWNYPKWRDHEHKALEESGITGTWIGRTPKEQAALRVD